MIGEPDIVKKLREEEKSGKLHCSSQEILDILNVVGEEVEGGLTENMLYSVANAVVLEQMMEESKEESISSKKVEIGSIEDKYKKIFENYAVAITLANENEKIISWNKYAEDLLGMDANDLFMKPVSSLYTQDEWKRIRALNIRKKGMENKLETQLLKKDGDLLDVEISLCVLKSEKGKTVGSIGIIKDITKLKNTERKLLESEHRYKTIFDNSAVAITLTDENENIISWNKYAKDLLGFSEKDLFKKPVKSLYPDDEWKKIRAENVRQKGMQHTLETKIIRENKSLIDVNLSLSVLKNHKGEIVGSIGVIKDITRQKWIEKKLEHERELLQSLLDNIPDSIYFKDEQSKFIKVNKAKAKHYNYKPEEMVGKTDYDILLEDEAERIYEDDKIVMKTGKPIINKIEKITDLKGNEHWISVTKTPRRNKNGEIIGTMGISRDVTELKTINEDLKKSEEQYKNLFEYAIDPIIILDEQGNFVDFNKQVTKLLGYSKKDLIGKRFDKLGILSKDSIKITMENFEKRLSGEDIPPYEIEIIAKGGDRIFAELNANPLTHDGKIIGDLVILRDLSEKKKNEEKLVKSETKFRDIFDASSDFLIYLDVDGNILHINNTAVSIGGLREDKFVGKHFSELSLLFPKKDMQRHLDAIKKSAHGKKLDDFSSKLSKIDGMKYEFSFSYDYIEENGKINGISIRGKDITQRQRAWDELVKLEERYRVLAETSADGVLTIDPLGRLTYVNPSFEKMCGRRKSQILATIFREYLSNDSVYLFQQIFIDVRKKNEKIENVDLEIVHTEGHVIPIEVNIAPLKKSGEFTGMICTIRDITERKKVEYELKKSERLKTEFMNIAAHELKSPVTPIKGYLDLIISDKTTSETIKKWAKISLRNSERLLKLVDDILDVSRLDSGTMRFDMEKLNTVDILDEIIEDMKPATDDKKIQLKNEVPRNLPHIMGDKNRLSQVLKNLMVNAVKFTDHGSITIFAEEKDGNIFISIEDTGIGVSNDQIKKIFTKFYQAYTGDDRKNDGTGLGLFICKEIIEKHNGKIWANSTLGKGSKFMIKLPHL